jgi:hypothetical protein
MARGNFTPDSRASACHVIRLAYRIVDAGGVFAGVEADAYGNRFDLIGLDIKGRPRYRGC